MFRRGNAAAFTPRRSQLLSARVSLPPCRLELGVKSSDNTNIILPVLRLLFAMNFVPWTATHRSWSIGRLQLTNLIACIRASQLRDTLHTRSRLLRTSVPQRSTPDPLATAVPSTKPSSPKKMSDIPGEATRSLAARPLCLVPARGNISHPFTPQRTTLENSNADLSVTFKHNPRLALEPDPPHPPCAHLLFLPVRPRLSRRQPLARGRQDPSFWG
jgi:hypothetical protein